VRRWTYRGRRIPDGYLPTKPRSIFRGLQSRSGHKKPAFAAVFIDVHSPHKMEMIRGEQTEKTQSTHSALTEKIEEVRADLIGKIDGVRVELSEKLEANRIEQSAKTEAVRSDLNGAFERFRNEVNEKFDALRSEIASLKVWALSLYFALACSLLFVMAKGFKWL
jgi:hypothetical protein